MISITTIFFILGVVAFFAILFLIAFIFHESAENKRLRSEHTEEVREEVQKDQMK